MPKRKPLPKQKSKQMFSKHASQTNKKNITTINPMRGGIRM